MELGGVRENSTFGYDPRVWEAAKQQATDALRLVAKSARQTIAYSDLAKKIRAISFDPRDHSYHSLLGQISVEENAAGRGMLSVLVVHKSGDLKPGPGFFELASHLGRDVADLERCWVNEFRSVVEANGGRLG
jgi:hypothetical protein